MKTLTKKLMEYAECSPNWLTKDDPVWVLKLEIYGDRERGFEVKLLVDPPYELYEADFRGDDEEVDFILDFAKKNLSSYCRSRYEGFDEGYFKTVLFDPKEAGRENSRDPFLKILLDSF